MNLLRQTCNRLLVPTRSDRNLQTTFTRNLGLIYSWKKGINRDNMMWLHQPLDISPAGFNKWLKNKKWEALVEDYKFVPERVKMLGPDLAAAHFIVSRGGAVKFEGFNKWFEKHEDGKYSLPLPNADLKLEAIDASNTDIMYHSFDNFECLDRTKYLNLSHCQYVDDWCLDRLVQLRHCLLVLDLGGCSQVTERGLACLHKLNNLKRLHIGDMVNVRYGKLIGLMLEEALPGCVVEGIDYSDGKSEEIVDPVPTFLKSWESAASEGEREILLAAKRDGIDEIVFREKSKDIVGTSDAQQTK